MPIGATALAGVLAAAGVLPSAPDDPPRPPAGGRPAWDEDPAERFALLPGIGPVLADRIVETRRREGGIRELEDLLKVPGIGPRTIEAFRDLLEEPTSRTPSGPAGEPDR